LDYSAAHGAVVVSGYIADSFTTFAPFGNALGEYTENSPGPIQHGVEFHDFAPGFPSYPSRHASAVSSGGAGFVGSATYVEYAQTERDPYPGTYYMRSEASVEATWTDIIVTGPAGATMVPIAANILIDGSFLFAAGAIDDPLGVGWSQFSSASFGVRINGEPAAFGNWTVTAANGGPVTNTLGNGVFTDFDGSYAGTTSTVMVPVNTPFSISMFLQTNAQVSVPRAGTISLGTNTNFGHTASFATTGPAFDVPDGYTVNSAEASVTDNAFVLVPAPASVGVMAAGGVAMIRRRRQTG
jgi:hypothetical protein